MKKKGKYPNFYRHNGFRRNCEHCKGKGIIVTWESFWKTSENTCNICGGRGKLGK